MDERGNEVPQETLHDGGEKICRRSSPAYGNECGRESTPSGYMQRGASKLDGVRRQVHPEKLCEKKGAFDRPFTAPLDSCSAHTCKHARADKRKTAPLHQRR